MYANFEVELASADPQPDPLDFQWVLSVDGSSNQQGRGVGVILEGRSGLLIEQALRFAFKASHNQAEYEAFIVGLFLAKELGARSLLVKSDSLLVTRQVMGECQAKDLQLASYLRCVMLFKEVFSAFELVYVPREQNSQADLLSKIMSSGKRSRQRSMIQETLKSPGTDEGRHLDVLQAKVLGVSSGRGIRHRSMTHETLKAPKIAAYGSLGEELFEVLQVDTTETWITHYQRYLTDRLLPAEPIEAKMIKRNAGKYTLIDGKLFRHGYTHLILTCGSGDQCTHIMVELYEGICSSHVGGRAFALKVIRVGYYWPTMKEDFVKYAQRCEQCQKHADWHHALAEELLSIYSSWPFHTWGIDILGPFPVEIRQMKYLIVAVEHPQKNGQIELANRVLLRGLKRRLEKAKGTWSEEVPRILWAYHTTPKSTTKETPFNLVYGSDAMIPVKIQESSPRFQNFVIEESNEGRKVNKVI